MQYRDVLPVTYAFGSGACWSGYEGILSDDDRFLTCHYNIFEPSWLQRNSIPLIIGYVREAYTSYLAPSAHHACLGTEACICVLSSHLDATAQRGYHSSVL